MDHSWLEYLLKTPLEQCEINSELDQPSVRGLICFDVPLKEVPKQVKASLGLELSSSIEAAIISGHRSFLRTESDQGAVLIAWINPDLKRPTSDSSRLPSSDFARARDVAGDLFQEIYRMNPESVEIHFSKGSLAEYRGALVACDLAFYNFKRVAFYDENAVIPKLSIRAPGKLDRGVVDECKTLAEATNLARHLTNLPPNWLNPRAYAEFIKELFAGSKHVDVEVWDDRRLRREKMQLLLSVGRGAEYRPRLVHIRYRPKDKLKQKPIAFVGKGVTFDSGGLNLKPGTAMRLMKKDMGGSASVLGVAYYADRFGLNRPLDFYLALVENSVDEKSFRPGDIYRARNGMMIEIHDTDAEGRLILADAIDVAVTREEADDPEFLIDVATLTGAIKTGLGADVAGMFCNFDPLAQKLLEASAQAGEPCWRMPLFQPYRLKMTTTYADMVNAVEGFGGAVTAALFLESFVRAKPWAHFDIYAWRDKPGAVFSEAGATGQCVQTLVQFLR